MVERTVELINSVWAERVAHLRAIEGDAYDAVLAAGADMPVVGDVGEIGKAVDGLPLRGVKRVVGGVLAHGGQF